MKHHTLFAVAAVLAGCADQPFEPDAPAFDRNAPRIRIESPARGAVEGDVTRVRVSGTASDDLGVASVTVNGVDAALGADGAWVVEVPVAPGTTLLRAIARDAEGNEGAATRAVVAGPMVSLDRRIADGVRATVSPQALHALGRGTATFIENGGLMTAAQSMNPVVDVGGGPDCLYAQASITSLTVGNADVLMGPTDGGVHVSAVLDDVDIGIHVQWSVSCVDGAHDVVLSADRVTVQGLIGIGVVADKLDVQFDDAHAQITGFDPNLPEVPDAIVQMLGLDTALSPILGTMTARLVEPMVEGSLSTLDDTRTLEVAGSQVTVDIAPTQIDFTPRGGTIALDTSWRALGDAGDFVFVPSSIPVLDGTHGFEIAIADDAANQLLTSMWSAHAFDTTIQLAGSSYDIGKLYDSVELVMMVPPYVDATARPLELTIGDWIATFRREGVGLVTVAIHAKTALYVVEGDDGKLTINVSTPLVTVDLVNETWMTKAAYDAIKAFAVEHIVEIGSAATATIPLPAIGDAKPSNLWVDPEAGNLLIVGDVE